MAVKLSWEDASSLHEYRVAALTERDLRESAIGHDFARSQLLRRMMRLDNGVFYAFPDEFRDKDLTDDTLRANDYIISDFERERSQSQWKVKFGVFGVSSKNQVGNEELVAFKSAPSRNASREYHATKRVRDTMFQITDNDCTYAQLGMFYDKLRDATTVVTRYKHGVRSLDNIFWRTDYMPTTSEARDALRIGADSLGFLHGYALMAHGDAQPKNIASNIKHPHFIDLETTVDFRTSDGGLDTDKAKHWMNSDIRDFLLKLNGDYKDLLPEFTERYVGRLALGGVSYQK